MRKRETTMNNTDAIETLAVAMVNLSRARYELTVAEDKLNYAIAGGKVKPTEEMKNIAALRTARAVHKAARVTAETALVGMSHEAIEAAKKIANARRMV